jgi:hypothetical protein
MFAVLECASLANSSRVSSYLPMSNTTPSLAQLQHALQITERIALLEAELRGLLERSDNGTAVAKPAGSPKQGRSKRTMSPESRARIAAAQKARWAKLKGKSAPEAPAKPRKKKGGLTPEGRARLAASMKARWAARKKGASKLA